MKKLKNSNVPIFFNGPFSKWRFFLPVNRKSHTIFINFCLFLVLQSVILVRKCRMNESELTNCVE